MSFAALAEVALAEIPGGAGPVFGPQVQTTLTYLTRKKYLEEIDRARSPAKTRGELSQLEMAKLELAEAHEAYRRVVLLRSYDDDKALNTLRAAHKKVEKIRSEEALAVSVNEAKERIKQKIKDAIAKRRGH